MERWSCSQRRICDVYSVHRSTVRRKTMVSDAKLEITELLMRLSDSHKRWGFTLLFNLVGAAGITL